jgi:hypothetical protein
MDAGDCGKDKKKVRVESHTCMGTAWFWGWLFTIGFLHLSFWRGALALALWAYYLGVHFSPIAH